SLFSQETLGIEPFRIRKPACIPMRDIGERVHDTAFGDPEASQFDWLRRFSGEYSDSWRIEAKGFVDDRAQVGKLRDICKTWTGTWFQRTIYLSPCSLLCFRIPRHDIPEPGQSRGSRIVAGEK